MSRRRYVSTEISTDTTVNRLATRYGDFAALLYTWMIPHAEDDCSITADPDELLMKVCPGRRDKSADDVQQAIAGMIELGLIQQTGNHRRLRFPPESFYKYQSYIKGDRRPAPGTPPDAEASEPSAQISANQRTEAQIVASSSSSFSFSSLDSFTESPNGDSGAFAPPPPQSAKSHASEVSKQVAEVWAYYREQVQPKARVCPDAKIRSRLRKFTVAELKEAVDRFRARYWYMAKCATKGGEWFFSDDSQVDKFLLAEPQTQEEYEAEEARRNGGEHAAVSGAPGRNGAGQSISGHGLGGPDAASPFAKYGRAPTAAGQPPGGG